MKSLKNLLREGPGPSSSHTIGPYRISKDFLSLLPKETKFIKVTLYGSLALTGKGHGTDNIIRKAFAPLPCEVFFDYKEMNLTHPNTRQCEALDNNNAILLKKRYCSLGGGSYAEEGKKPKENDIYPFNTFNERKEYRKQNQIEDRYHLIVSFEGGDILSFAKHLLSVSFQTIESSRQKEDVLPGPLKLKAVAKDIFEQANKSTDPFEKNRRLLSAFAYATSEANARGDIVVTAPTCGAAGVVPAVLYHQYRYNHRTIEDLAKAYLIGALVCDFIKNNASISGAVLGCQAEIGSACSFAAASLSYLNGLSLFQIEYASEVAREHFLGLTCDPVNGYVQIPCIERNAMASIHAFTAYEYAKEISIYRTNKVSFDNVILARKETGSELSPDLKETALGGLAKIIHC